MTLASQDCYLVVARNVIRLNGVVCVCHRTCDHVVLPIDNKDRGFRTNLNVASKCTGA